MDFQNVSICQTLNFFYGNNCKKALRTLPLNSGFFSTWSLVGQSKVFCKEPLFEKKGVDFIFGLRVT